MAKLQLEYIVRNTAEEFPKISLSEFSKFNSSQLGLGDISQEGEYFGAVAAIFDLEGFTTFCTQIDPHLAIPEYLNEFLNWLFMEVSKECTKDTSKSDITLYSELPFYAKFLGDGVLFIWDTQTGDPTMLGNIVVSLRAICRRYERQFLPKIQKSVTLPPSKLRCGIARGQIISIGDGSDYVGPCINLASRLQKLGSFSFAFSRRGFPLEKSFRVDHHEDFVLIKYPVRGVGDGELIYVLKSEFDILSAPEQKALVA